MIGNQLLEFTRVSIRSVWNIELLVHLRRFPERAWAVDELVRELRASTRIVIDGLRTLETAGLVAAEEGDKRRYAPASAELDRLARDLDKLYRERPGTVTEALFASSTDKLRSFADAFRLWRD